MRRDEADAGVSASRCSFPAGASPVSVSAGAPSSRPQARREIAVARAGCRKPLWREPGHHAEPFGRSDSRPGGNHTGRRLRGATTTIASLSPGHTRRRCSLEFTGLHRSPSGGCSALTKDRWMRPTCLASYVNEFVFRFNRRRSRSRGRVFYRVLELAVAHDPVRYPDLIVDPKPRMKPPVPPRTRGHPGSLERPPANRPWRVAGPASGSERPHTAERCYDLGYVQVKGAA